VLPLILNYNFLHFSNYLQARVAIRAGRIELDEAAPVRFEGH
jgi:hypothetical protein